jgi:hypothetical protein
VERVTAYGAWLNDRAAAQRARRRHSAHNHCYAACMLRIPLLLLVLATGWPLLAASEFTLHVSSEASPERNGAWRVHAVGKQFRADRQGSNIMYDSVLSADPDSDSVIFLNSTMKTWFDPETTPAFRLESRFLHPLGKGRAKKVRWELESIPREDGMTYVGKLAYVVTGDVGGGYRTNVTVSARIEIETTDRYEASLWPGSILPVTKYEEVDAHLAAAESQIEGFPTRLKLTTVRTYEGGAPYTDVMSVTASDFTTVQAQASRFVKPEDYRYERPVVAAPGVGRVP